jgi:hypothetical protein
VSILKINLKENNVYSKFARSKEPFEKRANSEATS